MIFGRERTRDRSRGHAAARPPLLLDLRPAIKTFGFALDTIFPPGCLYTRAASGGAVQSGTSSVFDYSPFFGVTVNMVVSGRANTDWEIGVLIEEARTNLVLNWRNFGAASWTLQGGATQTVTPGQLTPAGAGGARLVACPTPGSSALGETAPSGATGFTSVSAFYLGATPNGNLFKNTGGTRTGSLFTSPTVWTRDSITADMGGGASAYVPVDARDRSAEGGYAAAAVSTYLDFAQREAGRYPSSPIATTGTAATRAANFLRVPSATWSHQLVSGRVGFLRHLRPEGARSEYSGTRYIWWLDSNNHVAFDATTGVVTVTVAGATNVTSAITWNRYAEMQIYVEIGAGVAYVAFLIDGVRTLPTVSGSALGALSAADVFLASSNVGGHFCSWNYWQGFYAPGTRPPWAW